jgi:hypothetical protein
MTDDSGVPPNRFAPEPIVSEIGAIPDREYAPFSFDAEHDTLLFEFSREEFVKVLSALRNGAYMTYGDEGSAVYWSFLRNVDYPIMICASIIDCIEGDTDVRDAIAASLLANPDFMTAVQDAVNAGLPLRPDELTTVVGTSCDRDALWAGCIGLIQQMNRNNVDFLEQVEIFTNPVERITGVTGLIPQLKITTAVFDFVNELFADITENYNAEYTTDYENEVSCQLFCLALSHEDAGCIMSFDDIYNIFKNRLDASFTIESAFEDVIQYLATGTWSGTQICDFMFMFQLQCIRSATKFLAIDLLSLQQMFTVGTDEPNSGWNVLCTDCPPEPTDTCLDFTTGKHGWDIYLSIGTYVSGSGFQAINSSGDYYLYTTTPYDALRLGSVKAVKLTFSAAVTNITFSAVGYSGSLIYSGTAVTEITFDGAGYPSGWVDYPYSNQMIQTSLNSGGMPAGALLIGICFTMI